jgi:MFS family permease
MKQPLLMLLCALFFLAGGAFLALIGAGLVVTFMLLGMGVVGLLAVPIAWGRARGDPRAGGLATRARGGYAVLGLLGVAIFALIGLAMLAFGEPLDEDKDMWRVPNSRLEARIVGAVIFVPSAGLFAMGARRMWRDRANRRPG